MVNDVPLHAVETSKPKVDIMSWEVTCTRAVEKSSETKAFKQLNA